MIKRVFGMAALMALLFSASTQAQTLAGPQLLRTLQKGGNVIVMRHASSPTTPPDRAHAAPGNVSLERQLDATGLKTTTAMGKALRDLKIPVGMVLSSTAYRALQTALYLKASEPKGYSDLSDSGASMQRVNPELGTWIRELAQHPPVDSNMLIITHSPNIAAAFPQFGGNMADGEALIVSKDNKRNVILLGRIKIEDWPKLGQ